MKHQSIMPIWRYHAIRLLRSPTTWIMIVLVAVLAGTRELVTEHMPAIMKSLAEPAISEILASTIPNPSWEEAYAGWMKNLSQIITLVLLTVNAIGYASLTNNGDIPFILTKSIRRSHYVTAGALGTWAMAAVYAIMGATLVPYYLPAWCGH